MLLDWSALGLIISKFLRSPDGANLLEDSAQLRLNLIASLIDLLSQQLYDGSIVYAEFQALKQKEEHFVELAKHYIPTQPSGLTTNSPADSRLDRVDHSFAECTARLQRYEEQRARVVYFVEHFRFLPHIGNLVTFEVFDYIPVNVSVMYNTSD